MPVNGYQATPPVLTPQPFASQTTFNNTLTATSPSSFVLANARTPGAVTIALGGTKTTGDVLSIKLSNLVFPSGAITISYTVLSGDNLDSIGEGLAAAVNKNVTCQGYELYATSYQGVVTVHQNGPVSSFTTVTDTSSMGVTETMTIANSGVLSGGAGPVVPLGLANTAIRGVTVALRPGFPQEFTLAQVSALVAAGLPIT